jgi:Zn-dependent protease
MIDASLLLNFLIVLPLLIMSLALHELAHGWVAYRLGDPTAKAHGRLTLNPVRHLDLWGSVALVMTFLLSQGTFFFGWAKPVPVDPRFFKDAQRGMALVGIAGPLTNFATALVAVGAIWAVADTSLYIARLFLMLLVLNVVLGTLNLLPVPPLDGSRVVGGLLPRGAYRYWAALDEYGPYVFILLFVAMWQLPQVYAYTFGPVLSLFIRLLPGG